MQPNNSLLVLILHLAVFQVACDKKTTDSPEKSELSSKSVTPEIPVTQNTKQPTNAKQPSDVAPQKPVVLKTYDLDGIGYVIDAPEEWDFKKIGEGAYRFRIKSVRAANGVLVSPSLTIMKSFMGSTTPEAVAKRCTGVVLDKGTFSGAAFYNCEQENAAGKFLSVGYITPDGTDFIACEAGGLDLDTMNKTCRTFRKK